MKYGLVKGENIPNSDIDENSLEKRTQAEINEALNVVIHAGIIEELETAQACGYIYAIGVKHGRRQILRSVNERTTELEKNALKILIKV